MAINDTYRYTRDDPFVQEAAFIAENLDYGDPRMAAQRLQQNLNRLQGDSDMQQEMVKLVNYFDQNGVGTDLQVRQRNQSGYVFADVVIVDGVNVNGYRQNSAQTIGSFCMGEDPNYRYQDPRYGYQDPRYDYRYQDPRYANRDPRYQDPRYAYQDPRNQYDNRRYAHSGNSQSYERYRSQSGSQAIDGRLGLTRSATDALYYAQQLAAQDGVRIQITSAGRSYADQVRLYNEKAGRSPVARPGTSNHERGIAIDVQNYAQAKPYLQAAGYVHGDGRGPIRNDPYHFKFVG